MTKHRRKSWASWFPIEPVPEFEPGLMEYVVEWGERKFVPTITPFLESITTKNERRGMKP